MNKKICFVHLENIMAIPYLHKYTDILDRAFDVIYWDRRGLDESCGAEKYYAMHFSTSENDSKIKKLIGYIKFKEFASKILSKNEYDAVVLLTASAGVLLNKVLLRHYCGRYLIDIRDYFREHNKLYYNVEKKAIDNCGLAVVSSAAYKSFLPEHDYLLVHNTPNLTEEQIREFKRKKVLHRKNSEEHPIVVSFIGGVRFFEQDKRVLSYFANDKRFEIRYIGSGADLLREHCRKHEIENVYLHDRFLPEEILSFYADTDMILNLYGNGTPLLDYSLSNKLYYAAVLGLPILVSPKTYMEETSKRYGFGFTVDIKDLSCRDRLYSWYLGIDWDKFYDDCDMFMWEVQSENRHFRDEVDTWLKTKKSK